MADLKLIPLDNLIDELLDRFDSIIVSGLQKDYEKKNTDSYLHRFRGSYSTNIGLCKMMEYVLMDDFEESSSLVD